MESELLCLRQSGGSVTDQPKDLILMGEKVGSRPQSLYCEKLCSFNFRSCYQCILHKPNSPRKDLFQINC